MSFRLIARKIAGIFACCALLLALVTLDAPGASAVELDPSYYVAGNQIAAWYKPIVKPPGGWIENPEWSEKYERLVLFENGDMSRSKPIMYLRAHLADDMPLATYIKVAQERWLAKLKDSTIDPLADVSRPNAEPIKVFLYKNPSQGDQAFELTAFVKDRDSKKPENIVFLQIVVAAPSLEALDAARPAFYEVLGNLQ